MLSSDLSSNLSFHSQTLHTQLRTSKCVQKLAARGETPYCGWRFVTRLKQTYSDASPSAICVQQFDDSLDPAIHMTYRISLRSSSLREPRDPSLMTVGLSLLPNWLFRLMSRHSQEQRWAHPCRCTRRRRHVKVCCIAAMIPSQVHLR